MHETTHKAIAIVGMGAVLPDAPNVPALWESLRSSRYSISEVPEERWSADFYWNPDPKAPDKAYSKIGGWVREFDWNPLGWRLPLPPKVSDAMDRTQKWAIVGTREALAHYGYPDRALDPERTAVILGNAMAGDKHYLTAARILFPEYVEQLDKAPSFAALPEEMRTAIVEEMRQGVAHRFPPITEDTMPGELANIIAGRIANLFNFHGPNYICDAACASAMAAIGAAIEGLVERDYDAVITGGVDSNMSASTFIKFCKIGALSATGTRPYAEGADGFVMGEGAAIFVLKRLEDAERDGDEVFAVIRGVGGSSDGRGKGITAPNPIGQRLAVERAWKNAGLSPASVSLVEGHGTSTKVGDVVEVDSLNAVFGRHGLESGSVALGSIKSNIGHLKGAAGAAGILKAALALHHKEIPPSLGFTKPNPNIDFSSSPFHVNTEHRPWDASGDLRRAGVSAFGFGGTNFHVVLEEHSPGRNGGNGRLAVSVGEIEGGSAGGGGVAAGRDARTPRRGALLLGGETREEVLSRLAGIREEAEAGRAPKPVAPARTDLDAPFRLAIDYGNAEELATKAGKVLKAAGLGQTGIWTALHAQGIYRGKGPRPKVAFLYTGQGSQYVNMLRDLCDREPVVAETFAEADRVMEPLLGKPLTELIFVDDGEETMKRAEAELRQTAITQPAVLATDIALTRLMATYGIEPDLVMGHSLGEYGALVAADALDFSQALEAVSARGREMTRVSVTDSGGMAAVFAPLEEIEQVLDGIDGYVVVANINSRYQAVVGGATAAVEEAVAKFRQAGHQATLLPVSHAFHTEIVAAASEPLREMLGRLDLRLPSLPLVGNVTGELYPTGDGAFEEMVDLLARQIAAPVQFVKGLDTLYDEGARVFVEMGPKRALHGFVESELRQREGVLSLYTNHPKLGDLKSFNHALCGLYARGLGHARAEEAPVRLRTADAAPATAVEVPAPAIPARLRRAMVEKNITRLVKGAEGEPRFEAIDDVSEVIKLAGRGGKLDLVEEFGFPAERLPALDVTTRLAIGAGLDALRDAGIPMVMRYKTTTKGTYLPDRWGLPDALRDDTGVIFACAFPGLDAITDEMERHYTDLGRRRHLDDLASLRDRLARTLAADDPGLREIEHRIHELEAEQERDGYQFDRRLLFRILAMGHSQFAELIGARGPNTQINAACASTTQAIGLAEDWIRAGRCRRVIVISADDATSDNVMDWIGAGFLASGAAATDAEVEDAAIPFDRRRHGMIVGMGAAALMVESASAARERGVQPICEILSGVTANSAFHGTRLDVSHIRFVMDDLISQAERRWGIDRRQIAFFNDSASTEIYTPARGGSASAEIHALRHVFGDDADRIVIANTKGFTGHPMGVGIEDVVAVKSLETGIVPPVANHKETDPEFGSLNLSQGGTYGLRLADQSFAAALGAGRRRAAP
jgi:acyl transferase domain-containing protein